MQGTKFPEEELTVDANKLNNGIQQLMQNQQYTYLQDTLSRLYYSGDMEAYKKKIFELIPLIEKETGTTVRKEIPADQLKAYTTEGGAPHLDGQYTVFGKVIKGLEVIDKIAAEPKDQGDRPLKDIRMIVTVEEMKKNKIEKLYGYHYPDSK